MCHIAVCRYGRWRRRRRFFNNGLWIEANKSARMYALSTHAHTHRGRHIWVSIVVRERFFELCRCEETTMSLVSPSGCLVRSLALWLRWRSVLDVVVVIVIICRFCSSYSVPWSILFPIPHSCPFEWTAIVDNSSCCRRRRRFALRSPRRKGEWKRIRTYNRIESSRFSNVKGWNSLSLESRSLVHLLPFPSYAAFSPLGEMSERGRSG